MQTDPEDYEADSGHLNTGWELGEDEGSRPGEARDRRRRAEPCHERLEHLETVIDEFAAYGQTTSAIMQSSPVRRRGLGRVP